MENHFHLHQGKEVAADRLRQSVSFETLNLAKDPFPTLLTGLWGMDLIVCRGALRHLSPAALRVVGGRLHDTLAEGGWLVTGEDDPPLSGVTALQPVEFPTGTAYRRAPCRVASPDLPEGACSLAAAQDALERGEHARAAELAAKLRDDAAACAVRVRALACLGDPAAACAVAEDAVAHHRSSAELQFLRAILHAGLGREDEGARASRRVLALDGSLAVAHYLLGSILRRTHDLGGARLAYRTAADLAAARNPEESLPLGDGMRAGRLAAAARLQEESLRG